MINKQKQLEIKEERLLSQVLSTDQLPSLERNLNFMNFGGKGHTVIRVQHTNP
jgi:hypothetical protein